MSDGDRPNILVIWGDDIGITNLSCYSDGLMGYRTPNIDRIAAEGMLFTDSYGEQSCTAGRSSFITGQSVYRTGLSKVGIPGADVGLQAEDPTIAELLKPLGYATGQFGKNHLGDRTSSCRRCTASTSSSATSTTSTPRRSRSCRTTRQPSDFPHFRERFGPRGVIHSWATDEDDPTEEAALRPCRQAAHRGHRPADQEADGDDRRRDRRRGQRLHPAPARGRDTVLRLDEHHPHAPADASQARERRAGRALAVAVPRHDDRPRQARRRSCSTCSTSSASPRTRSSSTAPTTART